MFSFFRDRSKTRKTRDKLGLGSYSIEHLENRALLTTFTVTNLNDSGVGSFRQALLDANSTPGADSVAFSVAGTIALASSLPSITGQIDINGTTAPGYAGTPVVEIDYNRTAGLQFNAGSSQSTVRGLGLVDSSNNGITINGVTQIVVAGNYIGLDLDGATAEPNRGSGIEIINGTVNTIGGLTSADRNVISANLKDGVRLTNSSNNVVSGNYIGTDVSGTLARGNSLDGISLTNSDNNEIGNSNPLTGITYNNTAEVDVPVSAWQGIRGGDSADEYFIVGTSGSNGLLYEGGIDGTGTSYLVNYPNAFNTSVYGVDNLGNGVVRLVGVYKNADFESAAVKVNGFMFEGTVAELSDPTKYTTINYPGAAYNYLHSTMNGLIVGNYDNPVDHGTGGLPLGPGHAFIYRVADDSILTDITYPGALSNTAYGIWHNGETSYTIVGGYSLDPANNLENPGHPIGQAYMVDYDSLTGEFSNWTSFSYPEGTNFVTHFEGISSVEKGIYTLNADSVQTGSDNPVQGSFVTVRRNVDGTFGPAEWVDLNYTGVDPTTNVTSSNSVYGNQVVGVVINDGSPFSYQATINSAFQLSNVISGNGGNGIGLYGADNNQIAMNNIGTDVTGTVDLGNGANGILVTSKSTGNLIGGEAVSGNDPTAGIFVRPPQGNLISGNQANGVLITGKSTFNQLSGNFIGTTASGNAALGNALDGVAIVNANNNSLIGCTQVQDPFIYYNVIGGNGGNGLRVNNSNDTTIQANFFGLGADNDTPVGNGLNGVVIEGTSTRTKMGGPIPLGNVVAANAENGIVLKDRVSDFVSFNSFVGLAAFTTNPTLGNGKDGILVTSRGGNNLFRTNVISSNHDDGIEISGSAKGVIFTENIVGLNTNGSQAMGNGDNGIEIGGKARDITIGGPSPVFSVIPHNVISANGNNGIAISGKVKNIVVNSGFIGTDVKGITALGNANAGISIDSRTCTVQIGSAAPELLTIIAGNEGNGIEILNAMGVTVIGTQIGADHEDLQPMGNGGYGIYIQNGSKNVIGGTLPGQGNYIAYNDLDGVFIESGSSNGIHQNTIYSNGENGALGINLAPGANLDQPAPVLSTIDVSIGGISITGTLTGKKNTTYTVEYFASDVNGASGQHFLGSQTVKTDKFGVATLTFASDLPPVGASFFTATATDPKNNTSEFSEPIQLISQ
ncbi:MAG: right-handed parallel beta-helix repeat-containing protein [Planctomycetota bacterium]